MQEKSSIAPDTGNEESHSPLVTVIVPVYNVEQYVEQCLDSISSQTYRNLEIIVIDDGSTDESGRICDEFASRDSRATVIHEDNCGLSGARNNGIRLSHGEWISFIDSDDYLSPIYIETLISTALQTKSPIARVPFGKPFTDGQTCTLTNSIKEVPSPTVLSSQQMQKDLLYQQYDTAMQWGVYERWTLGDDPFPLGLYYEDLATLYRAIHRISQVAMVECREIYAYRMRSDSQIRQSFRPVKAQSALKVSEQLENEICNWYPELAAAAASRCFSVNRMVFAQIPIQEKQTRNIIWQRLKRYRSTVLIDHEARTRERIAAFITLLGIWPFTWFCSVCRHIGLMR
ncbi:glycosyltransferase family 2 protein [Bifidobacterium cebidarum]|uniref:Glycosyl transferase family 2 n=1 Tax=Bifidobacterium cebidarum TaxID=2650773 RepID=A0A6I1G9D2_9BIFI|nr:glycosyltransferase family 2 protein [Bifidobacterium cebidarum]KAB7788130.1 glycosyl transferase family 2 [Bifidobacterium cebidarum]